MADFRKLLLGFAVLIIAALSLTSQTMPIGLYGKLPLRLANTAADTATLTVGQMSTLLTVTPISASTLTTPTATLLCGAFPFVGAQGGNNYWYDWYVKNTGADSDAVTIAGGSGVTVTGTATIAQNAVKHFAVVLDVCTGTPGAHVVSLGSSTF